MHFLHSKLRLAGITLLAVILSGCSSISDSDEPTGSGTNSYAAGTFVWHELITHDIETARRFYGELFGWEFEKVADRDGKPYVLAKLNGRYAAGILQLERPADGANYSRWLGYMTVNDIDAALVTTHSAGGTVIQGARDMGKVGKVAAIQDSQSAVLGLIETRFDATKYTLHDTKGAVVWDELLALDNQKAGSFYSELAGYNINLVERRGGEYIFLETDGLQNAGILQNPFEATDPAWLSYFAVSDPVDIVAKTRVLGGKVLLAPSAALREGTIALIQDPDGAVLALQKWPL